MVLAGQYLERSVVVKSGELSLDALYHRGKREPPCVIAAPHPAMGGSMISPVIAELAWALTRAGHATLRFNYRGVGGSQGVTRHAVSDAPSRGLDLTDEIADFHAAEELLLATAHAAELCAVGYSFGAAVALAAAQDARVSRLILIAPPTALADFSALHALAKPVLVICAHHDAYCDRASLQLPEQGTLEIIPHTDHFFLRGLTELGKLSAAWLRGERPEYVAPPDQAPEPEEEHVELDLDPGDEPPLELDLPEGN